MIFIYIFVIMIMTFLGALGAYYFKKTVKQNSFGSLSDVQSLLFTPTLYVGGGCYAISAVINIVALRYVDYTILYPMTAMTYIWTLFISHFAFQEKITTNKIIAIMAIVFGIALINV